MTTYPVPTDWKSAKWWQNRPPEERVFHARIPQRYNKAHGEEPPTAIQEWVEAFTPGASLLITGRSGTGKTDLAARVLRRLLEQHKLSGRFCTADGYVEMLKDQFDNDNLLPEMYSTPYLVKYIQGVYDIVVLDGLGQERETEFATHELGSLLRRRYNDMHTLIVTTSLSVIDFNRRYGSRVEAAVDEMTVYRTR
jgi:DNA replication protein DnaC